MRLTILALLLSACATLPCVDEHTGLALRECSAAESLTSPEWRVFAAHQQGVVDGMVKAMDECAGTATCVCNRYDDPRFKCEKCDAMTPLTTGPRKGQP